MSGKVKVETENIDRPTLPIRKKSVKLKIAEFEEFVRGISFEKIDVNGEEKILLPSTSFIRNELKNKGYVANYSYISDRIKSLIKSKKIIRIKGNKKVWN